MANVTRKEVAAAIDALRALAEAIRAAGSIPSGHLYAVVMGSMSLESYEKAIGVLVKSGLVDKSSHVLTWKGPKE